MSHSGQHDTKAFVLVKKVKLAAFSRFHGVVGFVHQNRFAATLAGAMADSLSEEQVTEFKTTFSCTSQYTIYQICPILAEVVRALS